MRRMAKKIAVSVLVAVAALLLFWFVWPTPYRYMSKAPLMWRVNRFTGDVDVATATGWQNYARMKNGSDLPGPSPEPVAADESYRPGQGVTTEPKSKGRWVYSVGEDGKTMAKRWEPEP